MIKPFRFRKEWLQWQPMAFIRAKCPARDSGLKSGVGPELIFIFLKHSMLQKMLYTSIGRTSYGPSGAEQNAF
jgi:hypothetical protein